MPTRDICPLCEVSMRDALRHAETQGHKIEAVKADMQARDYVRAQRTRPLLASVIPDQIMQALTHIVSKEVDQQYALSWWGPRWAVIVASFTDVAVGHRREAIEFLRDNEDERRAMIMHKVLTKDTHRVWLIRRGLIPPMTAALIKVPHRTQELDP